MNPSAGQNDPVGMDRVAGHGDQGVIPRVQIGGAQVRDAFLGTHQGQNVLFRIELDAEAAVHVAGDRSPEFGHAFRLGVAVGAGVVFDRIDQPVDHVGRRGQIGVAHAEIDDVQPLGVRLRRQRLNARENVRR